MSVYVDPMMPCPKNARWRWDLSCHLVGDTLQELDAFAVAIGLRRDWRQDTRMPHYDLTENMRAKAVSVGAVEISGPEMVRRFMRRHKRSKK